MFTKKFTVFVSAASLGAIVAFALRAPIQSRIAGLLFGDSSVAHDSGATSTSRAPSYSSLYDARLFAFLSANEMRNGQSIEEEIKRVIDASNSSGSHATLHALLLRYLELDPIQAVRFASGLRIDQRLVSALFQSWAERDRDAALSALGDVSDRRLRRAVAVDLVGPIVQTLEEIDFLAELVEEESVSGFVVDALIHLSSSNPQTALRQAMEVRNIPHKIAASEGIAKEWARYDARAALGYLSELSDPYLRNRFEAAVVEEWVAIDPSQAIDYLIGLDGRRFLAKLPSDILSAISNKLAIRRPEEALSASEGLSGQIRSFFRRAALGQLIDRDLALAIGQFEELPESERRSLAQFVGASYARRDPREAVKWAKGLDSPSALASVMAEVARSDLLFAIDQSLNNPILAANVGSYLSTSGQLSKLPSEELLSIADKLVAAGQPQRRAVDVLMQTWSRRNPSDVFDWLLLQGANLDASVVESAAVGFALNDVAVPAEFAFSLPGSIRDEWIVTLASKYAAREPVAAFEWLNRFRGEPDYNQYATRVVNALAAPSMRNPYAPLYPGAAASIIETIEQPAPHSVAAVGLSWARTEPLEAVSWALNLRETAAREIATASAVGSWTVNDPEAARRFVLSLPAANTARDQALAAQLAQDIASHGVVDQRVINALGPSEFQQAFTSGSAFATAIRWLGSRDPSTARALLERHVSDSDMRQAILDEIEGSVGEIHKDAIVSVVR